VYTVHGFPFQWDRGWLSRDGVLLALEHLLARRTDVMLFQSREDLENAGRLRFPCEIEYLGNGVQDRWFQRLEDAPGSKLRAIFVGRLVEEKGILDLLRAAQGVPELQLTIVGSRISSERDDIAGAIDDLVNSPELVGRVMLLGHVGQEGLPSVVRRHDVMVLPSYREGVPRSIIEAMACALPVVATDIRGCRELVRPGVNGWLVPPGDVGALRNTLSNVAALPRRERIRAGERGFEIANETYREADVLGRLDAVYRSVLARR
jgi:glycosyltransferase involved in cell wall biosynthesis